MRILRKKKRRYMIAGAVVLGLFAGGSGTAKATMAEELAVAQDTVLAEGTGKAADTVPAAYPADETAQQVMYGIGSTSKIVVTAAVMRLSDQGVIDLDVPLTTYIPEFEMADARYAQITPRMLLDHSSGIPGGTLTNAMLLGDNDTSNHDQLLDRLRGQRLKADPGEFAVYCNDGFTLAEILVERVSGRSFTQYLKEEFTDPLGIKWFQTPQSEGASEHLAPIYDTMTGRELPPENANVIGSGGIYATAEELCKFAEIFMEDQNGRKELLSEEAREAMEDNRYGREMNPYGRDTTLSFGLGWDSVDTYPYSRYGVRALVKGGDTSFYHASLTVLPEENISCAVLASGGSSSISQLAVQEIVMTYLDEIGRIERDENAEKEESWETEAETSEKQTVGTVVTDLTGLMKRSGWYAGSDMMKAEISGDGGMTLTSVASGKRVSQTYQYCEAGYFTSMNGEYINFSGELSRGSNGRIGRTQLEFIRGNDGKEYLAAGTHETYPGLGSIAAYIPVGGKVEPEIPDEAAETAWRKISGKEFYLVSEKYSSSLYLNRFVITPLVTEEPEGYLSFKDLELKMAAITDPADAKFFQKVPGQAGRDLNDYKLEEKAGNQYLITGSGKYLSEEAVKRLPAADTDISIGENGETVWFSVDRTNQRAPVVLEIMAGGRGAWFVYDHTGRDMKCVSSSWTLEEGRSFYLPRDGRVAFAGEPGTKIRLKYAEE